MAGTIWSGTKNFTAASGTETVVQIPAPARGVLRGYTLVQTTGAGAGFDASLYTSDKAPEEQYHLLNLVSGATLSSDSDVPGIVENNKLYVAYQNRNGTPSLHERFLYLKITPQGTGNKNFSMSVTVENPKF